MIMWILDLYLEGVVPLPDDDVITAQVNREKYDRILKWKVVSRRDGIGPIESHYRCYIF